MSGTPRGEVAQLLFLPGASGNTDFWRPVAALLRTPAETVRHVGWPGFGPTPPAPGVVSLEHLAQRVVDDIQAPTALIAQSMGGVVALLAALARPRLVTHLVIAALSGGIDMKRHGAQDWRPPRDQINPADPSHLFAAYDQDLASRTAVHRRANAPALGRQRPCESGKRRPMALDRPAEVFASRHSWRHAYLLEWSGRRGGTAHRQPSLDRCLNIPFV